ncbi:hypothetical protein DV707_14915 (plasmid) [Halobellus limi]|uniref:Uncharacterized protein n=1 Tax=Halobellus limi TaxID=699433 RepID=A0A4D6H7N3_9EURY|nr:hypothetical protein DV707_14915 [Halobellus limi]
MTVSAVDVSTTGGHPHRATACARRSADSADGDGAVGTDPPGLGSARPEAAVRRAGGERTAVVGHAARAFPGTML